MNYKIVNINTSAKSLPGASILIIYTGGTFGMVKDDSGALAPFNFGHVIERIPELKNLEVGITVISFPKPADSSNVNIDHWVDLGYIIFENYHQYDGFVILHGTDTMAYSASALSFMLQGLDKPVIFTGAQLPIGAIRSDARENLMTSIELASKTGEDGKPVIQEVGLYFNHYLLRGNRSQKLRSSTFAAFESETYPYLAQSGVSIEFNDAAIVRSKSKRKLKLYKQFDPNVAVLKLYPGLTKNFIEYFFNNPDLKGVILETYGSGNTTNADWFLELLDKAHKREILLFNVSQCIGGKVIQGRYETSKRLADLGVIGGSDITTEAAITKMMHLLGNYDGFNELKVRLISPICGEMSEF